jgi:hypothetical protein
MSFDYKKIANINIKLNSGFWNPETHTIVLSHDPTQQSKFSVKIIPAYQDHIPIVNFTEANNVLDKYRKII